MGKANVVTRSKIHMYMNLSTSESPDFQRMGHGWSKLTENPNAQTDNVQYIDADSATTDTTSYEPNYSFEADLMAGEPTIKKVYDICQDRKTYEDCILDCVKVLAFEDEAGTGTAKVTAYREKLSVSVSSIDGTKKMTMSGTLNGQGDGIKGKFNLKTKTFTPDTPTEEESTDTGS